MIAVNDSPGSQDRARSDFALKHQNRIDAEEVRGWPVAPLLDRAKVTQRGQVTRTALLLLGCAETLSGAGHGRAEHDRPDGLRHPADV